MNFNYSYRAFLISCLLVGNLVLLLVSIKLSGSEVPEEEVMAVDYIDYELTELEEAEAAEGERMAIETHRAYNEAEAFINQQEAQRSDPSQETEAKLAQMSEAIDGTTSSIDEAIAKVDALKESKQASQISTSDKKSNNRNSTNSFSLKDRKALFFPNPVYTCDGFGKVVITIEVNARGKVTKATFNPTLSETSNACLVESALKYAQRTRFNTKSDQPLQLGTIAYRFPGQ